MNATLDVLENPALAAAAEAAPESEPLGAELRPRWSPEAFAREQVRGLVRQIFFSGGRRPVHQVVFAGVEHESELSHICLRVAQDLAWQVPGRVCLLDARGHATTPTRLCGINEVCSLEKPQKDWKQVGDNLWSVSVQEMIKETEFTLSPAWLRGLLTELRCEFQYAVIQAPAAGLYNETALLGQLCDGMVLVLQAHQTRRIAAHKVKSVLQAANVRLLGTVLDQRTFPIPDAIYRRL